MCKSYISHENHREMRRIAAAPAECDDPTAPRLLVQDEWDSQSRDYLDQKFTKYFLCAVGKIYYLLYTSSDADIRQAHHSSLSTEEKDYLRHSRIQWKEMRKFLIKNHVVIMGWPLSCRSSEHLGVNYEKRTYRKRHLLDLLRPIKAWQDRGGYTDEKWAALSENEQKLCPQPFRVLAWSEGAYSNIW